MDVIIVPFLNLVISILGILQFLLVVSVIMSWLVFFNILNIRNNFIRLTLEWFDALFEPMLNKIRMMLPSFGIDISPIILILLISFLQGVIIRLLMKIS